MVVLFLLAYLAVIVVAAAIAIPLTIFAAVCWTIYGIAQKIFGPKEPPW